MLEPQLSIHPARLVAYMKPLESHSGYSIQRYKGAEVRQQSTGLLSNRARIRLNLALRTLIFLAEWKTVYQKDTDTTFRFKLNFITLTLPAPTNHTDTWVVHNILNNFLRKWKKRQVKLLYVWKAECQDNGNIHFHITANQFIHYERLRLLWNKECHKAGICNEKVGLSANSTDVHSVRNIRNIAAYICSYVTKKDLYTKKLKRWLRVYKKPLADLSRPVVHLPRNYFNSLKRRPTCALWGASKPLLKSNISDNVEGTPAGKEFHFFSKNVQQDYTNDFISLWNLSGSDLKRIPAIHEVWRKEMNARLKDDNLNDKRYYQL